MQDKEKVKINKFHPNEDQAAELNKLYGSDEVVKLYEEYAKAVDSGKKAEISKVRGRTWRIAKDFANRSYDVFKSQMTKKQLVEKAACRLRDKFEKDYYAAHPDKKRRYIPRKKETEKPVETVNAPAQPEKPTTVVAEDVQSDELPGFKDAMNAATDKKNNSPESEGNTDEGGSHDPHDPIAELAKKACGRTASSDLEFTACVIGVAIEQAVNAVNAKIKALHDMLETALYNKHGNIKDKNDRRTRDGRSCP